MMSWLTSTNLALKSLSPGLVLLAYHSARAALRPTKDLPGFSLQIIIKVTS